MLEFEKALEIQPHYADIRNYLGAAYHAMGRTQEAIQAFRQALSVNPRYIDAVLNLAIVYRDMGERDEANTLFEQALRVEPQNPIALQNLKRIADTNLVVATAQPSGKSAA